MAERPTLIVEFWAFLKENKKWWLVPMLLVIALFAILIFFSGTPVAPFIYTLF
jgi:competence protein ComGC